MSALGLVGREPELAELMRLLARSESGSHAMQVEGDAGAGKTALWREGLDAARLRSHRVLIARPVEIEAKLSFAGLGDLLEPLLDNVLPALPEPQRRALEVALLLAPGHARPDERGVALAFLTALRLVAADQPVLVAIDDLQWLDSPSLQVVAFAARRLGVERVSFLVTRRTSEGGAPMLELERALSSDRLMRVHLGPLSLIELHRVVERELGHALPRPSLRRLHEVSEGNPFFALELARAMRHDGSGVPGDDLPVPQTLRSLVHRRLERIPPGERRLLLAVAALANPTRELLAALTEQVDEGWPPLEHAFESRIVEVVGGRLRFTHPLLGSILYADATRPARQELHRRLSTIVGDPEESARHLALAVTAPAPEVASQLEAAAGVASARGAPSSAGEMLELAIALTPCEDGPTSCRRRLLAADHWTAAGDTARAHALIEAAAAAASPGCERAGAIIRMGRASRESGDGAAAAALFSRALDEGCEDPVVKVALEKELVWSAHLLGDVEAAERHAHDAVEIAERLGGAAVLAETLADLAFVEMLRGRRGSRTTMDRALAVARDAPQATPGDPLGDWSLPSWQNALLLAWAGELERAQDELEALRRQAIARGDEHTLPSVLNWLSRVAVYRDDWPAAAAYAREAADSSVSAPGELVFSLVSSALIDSRLGNADAVRDATDKGMTLARETGIVSAQLDHQAIRGSLELSLGDLDAAHRFLVPMPDTLERHGFGEPAVFRFQPDLVETLVARGDLAEARAQLAGLEACGERLPRSFAVSAGARGRALLAAADDDAEGAFAHFEHALELHDRAHERFERARTLLVYGIALRRSRRKRAARDALDEATVLFEQLGAAIWAQRAHGELARISGAGPRTAGLTETERRIADLATTGRSNKQIAAELHITVRTVESNLTRVYRKHGVSSRAQLTQLVRP
ncbi:MAG TPA: AAA family ATPase [Gaiellales bacterium]|jgi:DNA-binding CsgD family transcriptional regulator